jgi:DNA-binding transcriptional regulator YiaG
LADGTEQRVGEHNEGSYFEASLLRGMEEMLAHQRGELRLRTRITGVPVSAQDVSIPPMYHGARVRALRAKLSLSPQAFATALNVSLRTLRAWEHDLRRPEGSTLRLLEIVEERPDALLAVLKQAG